MTAVDPISLLSAAIEPASIEPAADPASIEPTAEPMTLYVCATCRDAEHVAGQSTPCAGTRLFAAIDAAPVDPLIRVVRVECLSACKRPCSVSFFAPGKWTYVFGDLPAESAAETVLLGARLYAEAKDGLIAWKLRPDALKKGVLARVPTAEPVG